MASRSRPSSWLVLTTGQSGVGITGVGGIDRVAPGTTTQLRMKCEGGRFIQGELTYERFDRGAGLAEGAGDGFYQLVFSHLKLSEENLR
jgi:hypothetical protein